MPINSRTKGRAFEQEIARKLREELGLEITRNWQEQACHGGTDLIGLDGWAIECKRAKKYSQEWWRQTVEQASIACSLPVLIYKLDYQQIAVEVRGSDLIPELENDDFRVAMPFPAWITIVRERMDG